MDIDEIKSRFLNKSVADVKDVDLALRAAPFLIRELVKLQEDLALAEERIEHLSSKFKKQPPKNKSGQKGDAKWDVRLDEKKNRLYVIMEGVFDHRSGKTATHNINSVLENARKDFDAIMDFSKLTADINNRVGFHFRKALYNIQQLGAKSVINISNPRFSKLSLIFNEMTKDGKLLLKTAKNLKDADLALDNEGKFLKT